MTSKGKTKFRSKFQIETNFHWRAEKVTKIEFLTKLAQNFDKSNHYVFG